MQKNTISIDHNNKRILISRKNVSLTNNPDTSYINITKGRRSIIKIHMKKGYELIVNFTQYKTIKDKENNNPSFSITYVVEDLIELGLRTSTKCFDYYRNRIVVKNSKKKAINSNKEKAYKIYQEDCVKTIETMVDNNVKIPLIIMDPPYAFKNTKGGDKSPIAQKMKKSQQELKEKNLINGIDYNIVLPLLTKLQDKINIYIWCNKDQIPHYLKYYINELDCSFEILKWVKTNPVPNFSNKYISDSEYCLYFRKGGFCKPKSYEDASTLFHQSINLKDKKQWGHPTIKPIKILDRLIKNSSKEGDLIFDPYMGSGSTGVSALKNNRKFVGCEIDNEFFQVSKKRLVEDKELEVICYE